MKRKSLNLLDLGGIPLQDGKGKINAKLLNFGIPDERNAVPLTATCRFSMSEKPCYSITLHLQVREPPRVFQLKSSH